jgi:hypothetical protein
LFVDTVTAHMPIDPRALLMGLTAALAARRLLF